MSGDNTNDASAFFVREGEFIHGQRPDTGGRRQSDHPRDDQGDPLSGGYEVITAVDGAEALEKARSEKPDLILLDVMLPKLDGYRVCRLLKFDQKYKAIPIIMLTAKTEEQAMATGIRTGANQYLTKPIEPERLLGAVAEEL